MPNEYKIVPGLAIPPPNRPVRESGRSKVIENMQVGDSTFIENKATASTFRRMFKQFGKQAVMRPVTENDVAGYRVWCVEPTEEVTAASA